MPLICGIIKHTHTHTHTHTQTHTQKPPDFADTENSLIVARGGGRRWAKWVKGVKRYKLPVIKQVSPGDVMYSMATIVHKTVLHTGELLRQQILKVLITRKKQFVTMCDDVC